MSASWPSATRSPPARASPAAARGLQSQREELREPRRHRASTSRAFTDASCGGAKSADLFAPQSGTSNAAQLDALQADTTLVTFGTLGGNDIGLVQLAASCFTTNCVPASGDPYAAKVTTLKADLTRGVAQAKTNSPDATILVIGYRHLPPRRLRGRLRRGPDRRGVRLRPEPDRPDVRHPRGRRGRAGRRLRRHARHPRRGRPHRVRPAQRAVDPGAQHLQRRRHAAPVGLRDVRDGPAPGPHPAGPARRAADAVRQLLRRAPGRVVPPYRRP